MVRAEIRFLNAVLRIGELGDQRHELVELFWRTTVSFMATETSSRRHGRAAQLAIEAVVGPR